MVTTYYKNKPKDIEKLFAASDGFKTMVLNEILNKIGVITKTKEIKMTQEDIEQALAELEELDSIHFYGLVRGLHQDGSFIPDAYCDSIASHRNDTLHILIQAKLLSKEQLARIKKIDDYVLSHTVPERLQELKDWLKTNAL